LGDKLRAKTNKKHFTFLTRRAPYGSGNAQLCLDMVLACSIYDQDVSYVFLEDGVFQLLNDQQADSISNKTLGKALETLELYGVEKVYVSAKSMTQRGLTPDDLILPVEQISTEVLSQLINQSNCVFNL
jgi:tRNA 2-thiouridine synthesizing protein C